MTFQLYDVEGVDRPLRLSAEHAEAIGATVHVATDAEGATPKTGTRPRKPKGE